MGVWGVNLYAGDFAQDLRAAVSAVLRLPFDGEILVGMLCEAEPGPAGDPKDVDHETFWLVLADQFARRGVMSARVRDTALAIIDERVKTGVALQEIGRLRERIAASEPRERSATLRKPQPFLMDVGEVLAYPVCRGRCVNPYIALRERQKVNSPAGPQPWVADGWAATVIVDRGRAFGFLAWYRPLVMRTAFPVKPDLAALREQPWQIRLAGNCSAVQARRMGLETIGSFPVDIERLHRAFPGLGSGDQQAIQDISIANSLDVGPSSRRWEKSQPEPYSRIVTVAALASPDQGI